MNRYARILVMSALLLTQSFAAAGSTQKEYVRDKNPPEVEALIGKRFPASEIPGWEGRGGSLLGISPKPGQEMGIGQMRRDEMVIFVVDLTDQADMTRVILDAQVLPPQARLDKHGMLAKSKENAQLYRFTETCRSENEEKVVGMVRPLPEDEDDPEPTWSTLVQRAWKIDKKTGHITEISPEGISCIW